MSTTDKVTTPDLSHLTATDYEFVYEPAEDSFLLLDALESELSSIQSCVKPALCLEVGSGSGVIITALAQCLGSSAVYLSTDINPAAARVTRRTALQNRVDVQVINCDLVEPLLSRIDNCVDLLIFNPPYVPTVDDEIDSKEAINWSWAGGLRGRVVMDRLFPIIPRILSPTGRFYLLIVKENDEEDVVKTLQSQGMSGTLVMERRAGREHLKVLRFEKD